MTVLLHRIRDEKDRINIYEYNISKMFIYYLELDIEMNGLLTKYSAFIQCGDKLLSYHEKLKSVNNLFGDNSISIFRPLKLEKHTNLIIDMFDELYAIDFESLDIYESTNPNTGKRYYYGGLSRRGLSIEKSFVNSAPSIPILKSCVIVNMVFNDDDKAEFYTNLNNFLRNNKK